MQCVLTIPCGTVPRTAVRLRGRRTLLRVTVSGISPGFGSLKITSVQLCQAAYRAMV